MEQQNIVSVSWGDHLTFGEGDGRLATVEDLQRRMERFWEPCREEWSAGGMI
jgi:hypothetical protein